MKKLIFIFLLFSGITAKAQWTPIFGKQRFMQGLAIPYTDTAALKTVSDTGCIVMGRDSTIYYRYKGYWKKLGAGSGIIPPLQDVATAGNIYTNDINATIELNKYQYVDGSNYDRYFPFYFTGNPDFGDVASFGFTDNRAELAISRPGINARVVSINSEGINLFQNDELTENQSEISINQNGLMINDNGNTGTILNYVNSNNSQFYDVHMPIQNGSANDTLATLQNTRNNTTDTTSLSSRIDLRVKYTDTATMLTPYL
ncbi:hypothetical protein UFOVP579_1, partial [uncultured Caudovirales phage]